jgi:hypothetical protein
VAKPSGLARFEDHDGDLTRFATSSFVNRRQTCALTVASLMKSDAATSVEAPDPI